MYHIHNHREVRQCEPVISSTNHNKSGTAFEFSQFNEMGCSFIQTCNMGVIQQKPTMDRQNFRKWRIGFCTCFRKRCEADLHKTCDRWSNSLKIAKTLRSGNRNPLAGDGIANIQANHYYCGLAVAIDKVLPLTSQCFDLTNLWFDNSSQISAKVCSEPIATAEADNNYTNSYFTT